MTWAWEGEPGPPENVLEEGDARESGTWREPPASGDDGCCCCWNCFCCCCCCSVLRTDAYTPPGFDPIDDAAASTEDV